jgi:hypothetical protein
MDTQPPPSPDQLAAQIRFALADLSTRSGHHTFEELCRHFARQRISSNVLPATGPVSAGGDQGRDFETFRTYLRVELGESGGFAGRSRDGPLAFACTLQQDALPSKLRSDVDKIMASGTEVAGIYAFCTAPLAVAARHKLIDEVKEAHGVELHVFDGPALAEHLADPDLFWIAERYLSLPAALARPRPPGEPELPQWYLEDRKRWRDRGHANPTLGELLDLKDGLRHATFRPQAREDLPFWLGLVAELTGEQVPFEVRQRARYEFAVAQIRGLGDLRPAEAAVRAYLDELEAEDDPARLGDVVTVLSYAGTATSAGHSDLDPAYLSSVIDRLRDRLRTLLAADPPPTRRAALLEIQGHAGLLMDPTALEPRSAEEAAELPDAATLIDMAADAHLPRDIGDYWVPIDLDEAMSAWRQLAELLPATPLFPVDDLARMLTFLMPLLVDQPGWRELEDSVDEAVARVEGDAAVAARARDRAMRLLEADRILEGLHELHRAKEKWWGGDTLRGALLSMLMIAGAYAELGLSHAAKQYALAVASAAHGSGVDDVADMIPRGILIASEIDYAAGAWCSALGLAEIGMIAAHQYVDLDADNATTEHVAKAVTTIGNVLRASRQFELASIADNAQRIAELIGAADDLDKTLAEAPAWSSDDWRAIADEQLLGRPFDDLGEERIIRFAALGITWTLHTANDHRHAVAAERLAAAIQIFLVELAHDDICLLSTHIDIAIELLDEDDPRARAQWEPSNDGRRWTVRLTPVQPGTPMDPEAVFNELLALVTDVFVDVSLLAAPEYVAAAERAFVRGLGHKLTAARPYDELASWLPLNRFLNTPDRGKLPWPQAAGPVHEHPQLPWPDGPGPTYSIEQAQEMLRNRYDFFAAAMNRTLPRLQADAAFLPLVRELRAEGWLDWHILTAANGIALNVRLTARGLNTAEAMRDPRRRAESQRLAFEPETDDDPEVPLDLFTRHNLDRHRRVAMLSLVRHWNLEARQRTPDIAAIEGLLAARYAYWTDDIEHPNPFPHDSAQEQLS